MTEKRMVIDGVAYVEKKPPFINVNRQVCHLCALGFDLRNAAWQLKANPRKLLAEIAGTET
jgi:hypothetical protein